MTHKEAWAAHHERSKQHHKKLAELHRTLAGKCDDEDHREFHRAAGEEHSRFATEHDDCLREMERAAGGDFEKGFSAIIRTDAPRPRLITRHGQRDPGENTEVPAALENFA